MDAPTLTATLFRLGYTHEPAGNYRRHIRDASGRVVFTGTASEAWAWLRSAAIARAVPR